MGEIQKPAEQKKGYLLAYNLLLAFSWTLFLISFCLLGFQLNGYTLVLLNVAQGFAILEVLHVLKGWVKSPVFTTLVQVSSRIFVLILINLVPEAEMLSLWGLSGLKMVAIAWSITEIVRYNYYAAQLRGAVPGVLLYLRYSLFLVLYPLGVCGEVLIILSFMAPNGFLHDYLDCAMVLVLLSYPVFFPKLFFYMLRQRKKRL